MKALVAIALPLGLLAALVGASVAPAGQPAPSQDKPLPAAQTPGTQPAVDEWGDNFDGDRLDETKWESYTFEGGGGVKIQVGDKQLRMRGAGGSRSGIRSRQFFHGDRFYVEATLSKVGIRTPQPGEAGFPPGYAILTVLFDGNSVNRLEWVLRSDGIFEAWQSFDGKLERFDNGKLATKEKNPRLGIGRRGEHIFYMLNGEVGLERTIRGLSSSFKVMLYGFGATENNWKAVHVQTPKQ
jgi:hypothetical protein